MEEEIKTIHKNSSYSWKTKRYRFSTKRTHYI